MKRFEEHSLEEILNLSPEGYTHPAVVDGKLVKCEGTECTDCDLSCRHTKSGRLCALHFIEWLYSEVQEDTSEDEKADNRRVCKGNAQQKGEVMTNEEKNKKRFDELELGELSTDGIASFIAVGKDGEINTCTKIPCKDCIFVGRCYGAALEWLKSEAEPDKTEPAEEEKPEEKVERLMLEAKEIADKNSIPYVLLTKRKSLVGGGTAGELFTISVCAEVRIAREIGLSLEDLIEEGTRATKLAYQVFEELEEEQK